MVGWTDWWRVGEKKVKSPYLRAAGAARDSSKIEAIPVVATLRMAERSDTFRWMRVLQWYRLRYGTFVHFTLIAKYGAPASMQKKREKKTHRSEFARELKASERFIAFFF